MSEVLKIDIKEKQKFTVQKIVTLNALVKDLHVSIRYIHTCKYLVTYICMCTDVYACIYSMVLKLSSKHLLLIMSKFHTHYMHMNINIYTNTY